MLQPARSYSRRAAVCKPDVCSTNSWKPLSCACCTSVSSSFPPTPCPPYCLRTLRRRSSASFQDLRSSATWPMILTWPLLLLPPVLSNKASAAAREGVSCKRVTAGVEDLATTGKAGAATGLDVEFEKDAMRGPFTTPAGVASTVTAEGTGTDFGPILLSSSVSSQGLVSASGLSSAFRQISGAFSAASGGAMRRGDVVGDLEDAASIRATAPATMPATSSRI
ncbi:hypothetical protein Vafri_373 [Volvox africanus]|nr:hypothetical protein Vafri_373 [Volvox africanus]